MKIVPLVHGFLFAFRSGSVLYHFRDKARYRPIFLSRFFHTPCYWASNAVCVRILPYHLLRKKLELCGYPIVKKIDDVFSCFDKFRHVTDRRTDRQTSCDSIVRGKNQNVRLLGVFLCTWGDVLRQVNLLFLFNILRVLVTKLRQNKSAETEQAR